MIRHQAISDNITIWAKQLPDLSKEETIVFVIKENYLLIISAIVNMIGLPFNELHE